MAFQVCVRVIVDRLDDNCASLGPHEMHVRWVDDHAVFVRGIEAN